MHNACKTFRDYYNKLGCTAACMSTTLQEPIHWHLIAQHSTCAQPDRRGVVLGLDLAGCTLRAAAERVECFSLRERGHIFVI